MRPETNDIDRQAAEWAASTDGEDPSGEQQIALERWLAADERHLGAYLKARAVVAHVKRHAAAGPSAEFSAQGSRLVAIRRRTILIGSIAACFAFVVVFAGRYWNPAEVAAYETQTGQTRVVSLSDGSSFTLNTGSRVVVRYDNAARAVSLERGEALFDVKKDEARPFVVKAGTVEVSAVGTSFVVRALPDEPLQVLVREGAVNLHTAAAPTIRLTANSRAVAVPNGRFAVETLSAGQIARDLAWGSGHIFFRRQTLAAAAKEFARYSTTAILIDDPEVADLKITGSYTSNDPVGFAKAVALSLNLNAEVGKNEVRLKRRIE